jgi:stage V sporulation protein B
MAKNDRERHRTRWLFNLANKQENSFAKNVLMLMAAQILIKVLGLVYRLAITNIDGFGDLGNGYYSAGYQVYAVLLVLSSQGIPGAVSKLVSERTARGEYNNAHRVFKVSLVVFGIIGLAFSLILFFGADYIASTIMNVPPVSYVLKVLAPAIFFVCVSAVVRGYFAGLGTMGASSITQSLEQFFNCVLTILFVYATVGQDAYIMAAAGNVSTTLAVLISFSYLIFYYKKNIRRCRKPSDDAVATDARSNQRLAKLIIWTAIPLTIGSVISVVTSFIDTVTVSNCIQIAFRGILESKQSLEEEAMRATGILSKVDTLTNLPLAVNLSFYSALIPEITSLLAKEKYQEASEKISMSVTISMLIIIPCAIGYIVLANPILHLLYPNAPDGALVFQLSALAMIIVAVNHTLQGSLFGLGRMYTPAVALLAGAVVKIILNLILISNPNIGMYGAPISSIVCQVIAFLIIYITLKKSITIRMNKRNAFVVPIVSGGVMGVAILLLYRVLNGVLGNAVTTLLCIAAGALIYAFMILVLKMFTKEELMNIPMGGRIYAVAHRLGIYKE